MIADVRLVVGRDGVLRVTVEGRRVVLPTRPQTTSEALEALARMIEGVAWSTGRDELVEVADPASRLYAVPT